MRAKVVVATLLGVALLSGCAEKDTPLPPISEGRITAKWIEDPDDPQPCYKFTLMRTEREWDKKRKYYKSQVHIGYQCVPTRAYDSLDVGDTYRAVDWWVE